ncbi:endonuclease/exonuclease/phosphatase family protein [Sulfuricurvum sp.]|uniref:endonuclease/exonuclease/phosphatase family protein n=1 Tax=Sulfuricurvum sp. TaxID=2025608 RepID=UPI002E352E39|nr:endonuclease/exonuclease/phosphatase family protein [Sulfuricurvum sp.]HEX5329527.1 endonuclease/exonuclease/phosphatase family protein [Sulfuricurvum sp.]
MIKPDTLIRNIPERKEEKRLPMEFGLLCWNVHKKNLGYRFHRFFGELCDRYRIDLLALQEVKIDPNTASSLNAYHFSMAPNMRFFRRTYGVLNGSLVPEYDSTALLSTHREGVIQTRKSAIYSTYPMDNGESLLMVNLHAINFRGSDIYRKEIEAVFDAIRHHHGAMIVTGDFNSWNQERVAYLMKLVGALQLQIGEIEHPHLVKSFMNCRLDHIFYRGLKLIESCALDVKKVSDHNALYARFRTL